MPVAEATRPPSNSDLKTIMDILTAPTMQSSPPLLFSLLSGDNSSINTSPGRLPRQPIRKCPRICDLRHYQSTPFVPSQSASTPASAPRYKAPPQYPPVRGRCQRRCVSAGSPNRARNWFASPDRFLSSRSPLSSESLVQLGRAVPILKLERGILGGGTTVLIHFAQIVHQGQDWALLSDQSVRLTNYHLPNIPHYSCML